MVPTLVYSLAQFESGDFEISIRSSFLGAHPKGPGEGADVLKPVARCPSHSSADVLCTPAGLPRPCDRVRIEKSFSSIWWSMA